ncbi:MAG: efflux RND transporter periplasmic adaptor subunit [Gammaproteobacteria bacterium]|nr:efflux RND transporter periplasmic adaptor subunit [Gammaproteobacteria bacterium]
MAILISLVLVAWMASGQGTESKPESKKESEEQKIPKVEVTRLQPEQITRAVQLYGRTEPERVLQLSSEIEGRVEKILVDEGSVVEKGQVIIELALEDKKEQLQYAETIVKQRKLEYLGAQKLAKEGLQYESKLVEAQAAWESAKATVKFYQTMIEKSIIRAPFAGVLNDRQVEVGNFVRKGDVFFQLVDLDPLLVHADITEKHIASLTEDNEVKVTLVDGSVVEGSIRYIASLSTAGTNTFPIEVAIANPNQKMKAGISTELDIQYNPEYAIKVSPAVMALDKDGNLGVKTVKNDVVVFTPIDLIKAENDGVWLGGFEGETDVITLGQGFVRPGDKVITQVKSL